MEWTDQSKTKSYIYDVNWSFIIENRTILLSDFNLHSLCWNPVCQQGQRAIGLKAIKDQFELIVNNDVTVATRPEQLPGLSIIELTLTTPDIGHLSVWTIDPEYTTPWDHELITFCIENVNKVSGSVGPSTEVTGWAIKDMTINQEEEEEEAKMAWQTMSSQRPYLSNNSSKTDLDDEAQ